MNTLSFCSSSSANASFSASRTVISFVPLGVAYLLVFAIDGIIVIVGWNVDRIEAAIGREEDSNLEAGRTKREVTMVEQSNRPVRIGAESLLQLLNVDKATLA